MQTDQTKPNHNLLIYTLAIIGALVILAGIALVISNSRADASPPNTQCDTGYTWNASRQECVKNAGSGPGQDVIVCDTGYALNPNTQECVAIGIGSHISQTEAPDLLAADCADLEGNRISCPTEAPDLLAADCADLEGNRISCPTEAPDLLAADCADLEGNRISCPTSAVVNDTAALEALRQSMNHPDLSWTDKSYNLNLFVRDNEPNAIACVDVGQPVSGSYTVQQSFFQQNTTDDLTGDLKLYADALLALFPGVDLNALNAELLTAARADNSDKDWAAIHEKYGVNEDDLAQLPARLKVIYKIADYSSEICTYDIDYTIIADPIE